MQLILASASPRRKELMQKLGYPFEVIPAVGDEVCKSDQPRKAVQELASRKAAEVYASHLDCIVIGCDTVVDLDGKILGKPHGRDDALRMLTALSDRTHFVHTGVCVLSPTKNFLFCDTTQVRFRKLSQQEITDYVDSGQAFGKAGAYGIQDDSCFAESYDGDYDNVVGMPCYRLKQILEKIYKR